MNTNRTILRALIAGIFGAASLLALRCATNNELDITLDFHNNSTKTTTFLWQRGSNEGWHTPVTVAPAADTSIETTTVGGSKTTWFSLKAMDDADTTGPAYITDVDWSLNQGANVIWNGTYFTHTPIPR